MGAMVAFYTGLLGLVVTDQGEFTGRELTFLSRRAEEHHQLVLVTGRRVEGEIRLLSQISFRLADDDLGALRWFHQRGLELGAKGMEARNHGNTWSIYFDDPEGNRLELYTATPWYVSQPWRVALDLDDSDEVIRQTTRKLIEQSGTSWAPVETWKQGLAARLSGPERT
jgi:catechol 2,3-dioxygenase